MVKQQLMSKQRGKRLLELTLTELSALPDDTRVYEGIGKMFLLGDREAVISRIGQEKRGVESDSVALEKKLEYLEKTFDNAKLHIQAAMGQQQS